METQYDWFQLDFTVSGLPAGSSVPVSFRLDFRERLHHLEVRDFVDDRTLRLYRLKDVGTETEVPYQFSPTPQNRVVSRSRAPNASWAGEWDARSIPESLRTVGALTWFAENGDYRLLFSIPKHGVAVQVPYPPQNLHTFDSEGRPTPLRWFPKMRVQPQWAHQGVVHITDDDAAFASYRLDGRLPYLYPVAGPDGLPYTELGKPHDPTGSHAHHYSLWMSHANVCGQDFWSEKGGAVRHEQFEVMEDGPLFSRLVERATWVSREPPFDKPFDRLRTSLMEESRQWTFWTTQDEYRFVDVEAEFRPVGKNPVILGKTPFGFLAARVAQTMTVFDGGGEIVNAHGERNEQNAHWKRAPWLDQSGPVAQGRWGGVALFDCPKNPTYPTAWHCRNDGWAGAAFNLDRRHLIEPDNALRLRYRVLLHVEDAVGGEVVRRYAEYVADPRLTFQLARPLSDAFTGFEHRW